MGIRKLPFGYTMQNGQIQIYEQEAAIVMLIFSEYAKGATYRTLTEMLNKQPVVYHHTGQPWNKNMVGRILNNNTYLGTDSHPRLISEEFFVSANNSNPWRTFQKVDHDSKQIRKLIRCSKCENPLEFSNGFSDWFRWHCPICNETLSNKPMPQIKKEVVAIIRILAQHPNLVKIPLPASNPTSPLPEESAFQGLIDASDFDEKEASNTALKLASKRLELLGSDDYETVRIKHILAESIPETEILLHVTRSILIFPNGSVGIKLMNHQTIIGGE